MNTKVSASVDVQLPDGSTQTVRLEKPNLQVGRHVSCDICIPDVSVSRRHARLEQSPAGGWRIVDLDSKNGTRVNNQPIELTDLFDSDVIHVGDRRMTFRLVEGAVSRPDDVQLEVADANTEHMVVDEADLPTEEAVSVNILRRLGKAMRRLSLAATLESLLDAMATEFRESLRPDRVAVCLESEGRCQWPIVVNADGERVDGSDLPVRVVPRVRNLQDSAVRDWKSLARPTSQADSDTRRIAKRCFIFPVKSGARRLGHVYVERHLPDWEPPGERIEYLALLTRQAGLALEKMLLLEDRRSAEESRQELEAARKIQLQLLPSDLNLDPRLEIAARNHPAYEVSGDYYDCRLAGPGKIAFIIGDVVGHGLPAAILMTRLHAAFRAGLGRGLDLLGLDQFLNEVMQSVSEGEHYATGLVGVVELDERVLSLLCAGHLWPSIVCGKEPVSRPEMACSFPWGWPWGRKGLEPVTIPFTDRMSFLGFTDGVTEATDANGDQYSARRLEELHLQNLDHGADQLCEDALDDLFAYAGASSPPADDVTLLVMCVR